MREEELSDGKLKEYYKIAYSIANKYRDRECEVEELVQEAMADIRYYIWSYKDNKGSKLTTYIYNCMKNKMINYIKLKKHKPFDNYVEYKDYCSDNDNYKGIFLNALDSELKNELMSILSNEDYNIIIDRFVKGKTYRELANKYGYKSKKGSHSRVVRILSDLKKNDYINDLHEEV